MQPPSNSTPEHTHLSTILSKLRTKIRQLDQNIENIDEEIQKMDEYYWENYTEFDEYGYENFDNSQNRQIKVNETEAREKEKNRYLKMLDSPYFARIDFVYDGEEEPETYYIGIGSFSENSSGIPLIFDWRAPVSSLFYDYDKGKASFTAPGGEMTGEITCKRQYKIKGGQLKYFFESDINIDDDVLKKELSMNGSDRLKSIVTTIQKEQNKIIRDKSSRILVVQGTAGSGKTSIALHRVAYLLYNSKGLLKANNVLILSPNNVFADYISHILPELNEENISEMEFDYFAAKELSAAGKCQDRYDAIEEAIEKGGGKYAEYKQSREFTKEINGYVLSLEADIVNFRPVKFKKLEKSAEEIQVLFYEKFTEIPLLKRMEAIAEYAMDEVETLTNTDFDEMEAEIIKEKFNRLYDTMDIRKIYGKMLMDMNMGMDINADMDKNIQKSIDVNMNKNICINEHANYDTSNNADMEYDFSGSIIRYEDVYPMLYLKYQLFGTGRHRMVKHLVIDEMQDYSYIQYAIIEKVFKCHMTILGDRRQTIGDGQNDAVSYIREIFGRDINVVVMKKSYRQTVEIGQFAADIINEKDIEFFERHGEAPEIYQSENENAMFDKLAENIKKQLNEQEHETIAVLCYSEREAEQVYNQLSENADITKNNLTYMDKETEKFVKGVTVTTFYMAKGLEFDCVHIPYYNERYSTPFGKQALYVSATRAMHSLNMYNI